MMPPDFYEDLVYKYDSQLMELVHKHDCRVHVHCHGKISEVFERIIDMGADMLDPVEPPPDGDIGIEDAKRRANSRMTLIGNIEFRDMEFSTPEDIDKKVRDAICLGGKDHFILGLSATSISSITDRYRENSIQYIRSALEYGVL
jgi:uroporphyrinogen-III decarboxylase